MRLADMHNHGTALPNEVIRVEEPISVDLVFPTAPRTPDTASSHFGLALSASRLYIACPANPHGQLFCRNE